MVSLTSRHKIRAGLIIDENGEVSATVEQFIEAEGFEPTGLLDADGNPLYRVRQPIGFDLTRRR